MKRWRKILCIGLAAVLAVGMCACGKKDGSGNSGKPGGGGGSGGKKDSSENAALAKENVYRMDEYDLSAVIGDAANASVYRAMEVDGRVYAIVQIYSMDYSAKNPVLLSVNPDGSDMKTVSLQLSANGEEGQEPGGGAAGEKDAANEDTAGDDEAAKKEPQDGSEEEAAVGDTEDVIPDGGSVYDYTGFNDFCLTKSGTVYGIKNHVYEDYSDPENYISINETSLCHWDTDGNLLWETPIENMQSPDSWSYVSALFGRDDGTAMLFISGDKNGKITADVNGGLSALQPLSGLGDLFDRMMNRSTLPDGKILFTYYDDTWTDVYAAIYDPTTDTLGEETKLPPEIAYSGMGNLGADANGDILYVATQGLYKFHLGDEESHIMMNFINSDFIGSFNVLLPLDSERFVGFYNNYDYQTNINRCYGGLFTRVPPEDIPDKSVMVLGGNYIPSDLRQRVIDFNKKVDNTYRIVLRDYSELNTYENYNAGRDQLNMDIISGKMPDILVLDNSVITSENYVSKGLLADIGKMIEQDEELSKVEFMENVFDACRIDGKLYEIVPAFNVSTYIAKTSIVGNRDGWTMEEAKQVLDSMPEGTELLGDMKREYFFYSVLNMCGRDFVDVSTGKCSFDSQEFIDLLEFAKTLPTESQDSGLDYGEEWYDKYQSQYIENRTILGSCYIGDFTNLVYTIHGNFGEEVTFVGFPTANGNGSVINPSNTYALSAKSANLDAAWDFMRYYLTEEYQSTLSWNLPVAKKYFDIAAAKGMEKPYYMDENQEKVEYEYTNWINGEEVTLEPLTQAEVDKAKAFVASVNKKQYYNEDIQKIVMEEIDAFYQNQKSASEVAGVIQSRAQIFVNENR